MTSASFASTTARSRDSNSCCSAITSARPGSSGTSPKHPQPELKVQAPAGTASTGVSPKDPVNGHVAASDPEQAKTVVARIFCPDRDHAPPCTIPWESRSSIACGSVNFVFYATDDQAQEILADVSTQGFGEVRLFKSTGEDGQPIDGSTVIEQFHIEQSRSYSASVI
jgi:hypothetical protein